MSKRADPPLKGNPSERGDLKFQAFGDTIKLSMAKNKEEIKNKRKKTV